MPRSNWKGVISFGLVSIPIVLYNAVNPSSTVSFKQINKKTGNPIRYKRVDVETEKEVPWEQIGKGFEYEKDVILPVEEGELQKVAGENARTIAIEEFIDKKNLDPIFINKTYYIVPDKKGDKGYVILRDALSDANKIGIAKVIISTKEYLAAVVPHENALVLFLLHYDEEMRKISDFDVPSNDLKKYKVTSKEIEIAKKLVNSMAAKWKPEKYKDEYKEVVEEWVEKKSKHLPEPHMEPRSRAPKQTGKTVDFVGLLKKSLEKPAKSRRDNGKRGKMVVRKESSHRRAVSTRH